MGRTECPECVGLYGVRVVHRFLLTNVQFGLGVTCVHTFCTKLRRSATLSLAGMHVCQLGCCWRHT